LKEADILFEKAKKKLASGHGSAAAFSAYQDAAPALKFRQRWAPNSALLVESLGQVAYLDAQIQLTEEDPKQRDQARQRAEDNYQAAIKIVSDHPDLLDSGKKTEYMLNLAELYIQDEKYDKAAALLEELRTKSGKSVDALSAKDGDPDSKLLAQFAKLYWGEDKYVDAARLELRLAIPSVRSADLAVQKKPPFAGYWKMPSKPDEDSFELTVENNEAQKLTARVEGANPDKSKKDGDPEATGSFDGPIGEISWNAYGGPAKAKIIRIGKYLVWKIIDKTPGPEGSYSPDTAILKKEKPPEL
jgi:tetratricopeptide (TPR) repeat protein